MGRLMTSNESDSSGLRESFGLLERYEFRCQGSLGVNHLCGRKVGTARWNEELGWLEFEGAHDNGPYELEEGTLRFRCPIHGDVFYNQGFLAGKQVVMTFKEER